MSRAWFIRFSFVAALAATALPSVVLAWTPGGAPVAPSALPQRSPAIVSDGSGGAFIVWQDTRGGQNSHTVVQRIVSSGALAPGWPNDGRLLASDGYRDHAVAIADESGGLYVADDGTARAGVGGFGHGALYRITADGAIASGWPEIGVRIAGTGSALSGGPPGDYFPALCGDGNHGAFVTWTTRARFSDNAKVLRLQPDGVPAEGWPGNGVYAKRAGLTYGQEPVACCRDGSGGVFVAWSDYRVSALWVARLDASGATAPGWPVRVVPSTASQSAPGVVPDGVGGVYVAWQDSRAAGIERTYGHHLRADGTPQPSWPVDGLALSKGASSAGIVRPTNFDAASLGLSSIVEDGQGGAYVAWTENGDIFLQHLTPDGIFEGWREFGLQVAVLRNDQSRPTLAADLVGGVFVTWQDGRSGRPDIYAQHVRPDGSLSPGWAERGNAVCVDTGTQTQPVIAALDSENAIVAWTDDRGGTTNVYAGVATPEGVTAISASLQSIEAMPGRVTAVWQVAREVGPDVTVYRSPSDGSWSAIATAAVNGRGEVRLEDENAPAGRVGYRIGWLTDGSESFSEPEWVIVPGFGISLRGTVPNPARKGFAVSFTLASREPAWLTVTDVMGREVTARNVADSGPGNHVVDLGLGPLPAGIYLIRLVQGGVARTARACVVR